MGQPKEAHHVREPGKAGQTRAERRTFGLSLDTNQFALHSGRTMQPEHDTIPTTDAAVTTQPGSTGAVVVDFDTYKRWILGEAAALDVVEKVVGFE